MPDRMPGKMPGKITIPDLIIQKSRSMGQVILPDRSALFFGITVDGYSASSVTMEMVCSSLSHVMIKVSSKNQAIKRIMDSLTNIS